MKRWLIGLALASSAVLAVTSTAGSSTTYGPVELTIEVDRKACATGLIQCTETGHEAEPAGPTNHNPVNVVVQVLSGNTPVTGLRYRDFHIVTGIGPPGSGQPLKLKCELCFGGQSTGLYAFFMEPDDLAWKSGTYMMQIQVEVEGELVRALAPLRIPFSK